MDRKIALRQEAIRRYLAGEKVVAIGRSLGRSRQWVARWIERYQPDLPEESLRDRSHAPRNAHFKWCDEVRQQVLNSRRMRMSSDNGYRYALIGAEAIHYELQALGQTEVPPVRTVHYWLKSAGLVKPPAEEALPVFPSQPYPKPETQRVNALQELDLKGPFYLKDDSQKYYLMALRDYFSKTVALDVARDKQAPTIAAFLVQAWQRMGLPEQLQMDNGLEFRGSNRYPRSFGKVVRLCLAVQVKPLFIPPHEPWRNGLIENLNGLVDRLFLERDTFANFDQLQTKTRCLEASINQTHRLPALNGKTPEEFASQFELHLLSADFDLSKRNLQLVKGCISFIRKVRKSGRITLCANDKFDIDPNLCGQYVLARVNLDAQKLEIFLNGQSLKTFDYTLS
jgi:putative transposase